MLTKIECQNIRAFLARIKDEGPSETIARAQLFQALNREEQAIDAVAANAARKAKIDAEVAARDAAPKEAPQTEGASAN